MADYTIQAQTRDQLFDQLKQLPTKVGDTVRWRADSLASAIKTFNGAPPKPIIDTSPNRGTAWMSKRR